MATGELQVPDVDGIGVELCFPGLVSAGIDLQLTAPAGNEVAKVRRDECEFELGCSVTAGQSQTAGTDTKVELGGRKLLRPEFDAALTRQVATTQFTTDAINLQQAHRGTFNPRATPAQVGINCTRPIRQQQGRVESRQLQAQFGGLVVVGDQHAIKAQTAGAGDQLQRAGAPAAAIARDLPAEQSSGPAAALQLQFR